MKNIKSSGPKCPDILITYCLQELSTDLGLRVLINFDLEISRHFGPKNHTRKIDKIRKDFWIILNFHTFYPKMLWYPKIIYHRRAKKVFLPLSLTFPFHNFILIFICKNWFYSVFLIFWRAPITPSCWMSFLFNKQCFFYE